MAAGQFAELGLWRRWRQLPQSAQSWVLAGLIIVVMLTLNAFSAYMPWTAAHRDIVVHQFRLPASADFEYFRASTKMRRNRPDLEAIVRFTPEAFTDYFTQIDDARLWAPVPFAYDGVEIEAEYTPAAHEWTNQRPIRAGERRARWGGRVNEAFNAISNGRFFCLAIQNLEGERSPYSDGRVVYRGAACRELARNDPVFVLLLAAIDFDTRRLLVRIR